MRNGRGHTDRLLLVLCLCGVALRLVFLFSSRDLDLVRDESHYVYLAITWNRLGFYLDSHRYLWPPGYPFLLAQLLRACDLHGLLALKGVQVGASASVGLSTMALARRLTGDRAAIASGVLWCVYLPLIGFTHTLWSETLFLALALPGFALLASVLDERAGSVDASYARLLGAGALFSGALYLKDALLPLAPLLALLLVAFRRGAPLAHGVRQALLLPLAIAVLVLPWTLRNAEVYGHLIPVGSTLGENAFRGLNATYRNFDLAPFQHRFFYDRSRADLSRRWFTLREGARDWERADEIHNTADRLSENVRRGVRFALEDPGWLVRSRIKKLADLVAPYSFFVRHLGIGGYEGTVLARDGVRQALLVWAYACPIAVLWCAVPGLVQMLRRPRPSAWLVALTLSYFGATALLVSMSRFRVPLLPFAIALAGGFLAGRTGRAARDARFWVPTSLGWVLLLFLWWVNAPETGAIFRFVWEGTRG